jgi:ABC-type Na+ transport system ATPase subunit NatA
VIVVIGPNGAGKSTMMNILSGALEPSEGTLSIMGGEPTTRFKTIQKYLGVCFQENVLIPLLTMREHLLLFGAFRGVDAAELESAIDFFADTLQLREMMTNRARDLSGGQKRKLCISLSLLGNPPIVIMDEPTAGVDVQARQLIWKTISALKDTTTIVTSHALEEAEAVSSRLFIVACSSSHLCYVPEEDVSDITYFVDVETQMTTAFPRLPLPMTSCAVEECRGSDLLAACTAIFEYECSDAELFIRYSRSSLAPVLSTDRAVALQRHAMKFGFVFRCHVDETDQKLVKRRVFFGEQLVISEQNFVNDIAELLGFWKTEITAAGIFTADQLRELFQNVEPIFNAHNLFLSALRRQPISFAAEYGALFLRSINLFRVGAPFVSKYKRNDAMIREMCNRHSFRSKWLQIEQKLPSGSGRDFLSFYVTPVQRYPRYPLLLRDLGKTTPLFHPDKLFLNAAIHAIDKANRDIDRDSEQESRLEDMNPLQKLIGESVWILDPRRSVVAQAEVQISRPRPGPGILYLFNDQVLLVMTHRKPHHVVIWQPILDFRFASSRPNLESFTFFADEKEWVVHFNEYSEKQAWLKPFIEARRTVAAAIPIEQNSKIPVAKWLDLDVALDVPALSGHDGASVRGSVWFFGGLNAACVDTNCLIRYEVQSGLWATTEQSGGPMPCPRHFHTVTPCKNTIYVCFGMSKKQYLNDIWRYDTFSNTWKLIEIRGDPLPRRMGHSCVAVNMKLCIFGGVDQSKTYLSDILLIDPDSGTYERIIPSGDAKDSGPIGRAHHSMVYRPNPQDFVITGGVSSRVVLSDCWVFSMLTRTWRSERDAMTQPRAYHRSFLWKTSIFLIGGTNKRKATPMMAVIDALMSQDWKEGNSSEYGNIPFGTSSFSLVEIAPATFLFYGGRDPATGVISATSYMLELQGGLAPQPTRGLFKYIPPSVILTGRQRKEKAMASCPAGVEKRSDSGVIDLRDFINEARSSAPSAHGRLVRARTERRRPPSLLPPISVGSLREFARRFNVDRLPIDARVPVRQRIKRLWKITQENEILGNDLTRKEARLRAVQFPGRNPIMLKIRAQKTIKVVKIQRAMRAVEIELKAAEVIGEGVPITIGMMGRGQVPLCDEELRLILLKMAQNGESVIVIMPRQSQERSQQIGGLPFVGRAMRHDGEN